MSRHRHKPVMVHVPDLGDSPMPSRPSSLPTAIRQGPHEPREWREPLRADPLYDIEPAELDWHELMSPLLWLAAVAVLAGLVAAMWLIVAVVPAS